MDLALVTQYVVNACQEDAVLATEGKRDSSYKTENFSHKGMYVSECVAIHLKEG